MNPIEPPDTHHLKAAQGWLELGNPTEAGIELDNVSPALKSHPAVLELRWAVAYAVKDWAAGYEIAVVLVELMPGRADFWRHRSASVHFAGNSRQAYDLLFPALAKFPDDWAVQYDMACYACVLGSLNEARAWLKKAFELSDKVEYAQLKSQGVTRAKSVKQVALEDPDLKRLWPEISES